jgi:hypothetical protein
VQNPLLQICPWFEQLVQVWPFLPQAWSLVAPNAVHTPAWQQLDAHVCELQPCGAHALLVHTWEAVVQFAQACPFLPHWVLAVPVRHMPFEQHPLGQVAALHTAMRHSPAEHIPPCDAQS